MNSEEAELLIAELDSALVDLDVAENNAESSMIISGVLATFAASTAGALSLPAVAEVVAVIIGGAALSSAIIAFAVIGIIVAVLAGSAALAQSALDEAIENISQIRDTLKSTLDSFDTPNDRIELQVNRNRVGGDSISIFSWRASATRYEVELEGTIKTGWFDTTASNLINAFYDIADNTDLTLQVKTWTGTYIYYGNDIWSDKL